MNSSSRFLFPRAPAPGFPALLLGWVLLALAALPQDGYADPAQTGEWVTPALTCWPDGAMHAVHVFVRETSGPLAGHLRQRCILWRSPGCPFSVEPVPGCPDTAPPQPCGPLPASLPARLWNPRDNTSIPLPAPPQIGPEWPPGAQWPDRLNDCNGHIGLAGGSGDSAQWLVIGGGCGPANADPDVLIFDTAGLTATPPSPWTPKTRMDYDRWYPSAVLLPNAKVLAISGAQGWSAGEYLMSDTPEVYNPVLNSWRSLPSATASMWFYPFISVRRDGRLFHAGPAITTTTLDLTAVNPSWTTVATNPPTLYCFHGSSVTYAPGKVLKCGGYIPTAACDSLGTTGIIDLNVASPQWTQVPSMANPRRDLNLVLMPDGKILALGGHDGEPLLPCGTCGNYVPVLTPEMFDPVDNTWTPMANMTIPRGYHSTAMLLQDGRVLACGGENWHGTGNPSSRSGEIYKPPYMFQGPRPAFAPSPSAAPEAITCCTSFTVTLASTTPAVASASLVRLGAVTHGYDENQRFVPLTATPVSGSPLTLSIAAPNNTYDAPPGWYMLFLLTATGVPSEARYVLINPCVGNLNGHVDGNCVVDGLDLAILLAGWSEPETAPGCGGAVLCPGDLDGNGIVNGLDLAMLLGNWGPCGGGGSAPMGGGGEAATAGGPAGPGTGDCGGGIDLFQQWLDSGDMDAFWQWLNCVTGGAAAQ